MTTHDATPTFDDDAVADADQPSGLNFPVVGIGASAGGMAALSRLFEHMPPSSGMAFVVILHLSPKHESNADEVLGRCTRMPVLQVTEQVAIEPNHVYVISPSRQLTMEEGHLSVSTLERPKGWRNTAIDLFFRTLARGHRERAVSIVLSGTGSDGSVGVSQIKEHGGVSIVQAPGDAEFDGMPLAAIATGAVDFVLPVIDMPARLQQLWDNARQIELPLPPGSRLRVLQPASAVERTRADDALGDVMTLLRSRTGHDFRHYKRATVLRRLERRMQVAGVPTLTAYRSYLEAMPSETPALLQDMLISVTQFFRDRPSFDALAQQLQHGLPNRRLGHEKLRVWVVGCATGEEAYSVAMLLADHRARHADQWMDFQVFATDIDERAIGIARAGSYPESVVADVEARHLRQFFSKDGDRYRVRKDLREKLLFAHHNVLQDPPFSSIDLICCRNLMIYLDREVQSQVLDTFGFSLMAGGLLFLGNSESADSAGAQFSVIDKRHRLYRSEGNARRRQSSGRLPVTGVPASALHAITAAHDVSVLNDLYRRLGEALMPPGVLVDGDCNLLHVGERAAPYLRVPAGQPSSHLLSVVVPELRLELRTAVFRAWETRESVEARRVAIERPEGRHWITMTARPSPREQTPAMLITFDEVAASLNETLPPDAADPRMALLEQELEALRLRLQGSLGRSTESTEALKASNEELQAINEELRSATEELDTSKEELQSLNEELMTVNHELKDKVDETGKVNDDLRNLIAATDIATIFVDPALLISRFTPRASELFSLIDADVGRSLLDITSRLHYPELEADARAAFDALRVVEREVTSDIGKHYLVRAVPYRTQGDMIEGAVLTFIDISALRQAEETLRQSESRFAAVVESTRDFAIITLSPDALITSWNPGAERLFGFAEAEILGQRADIIFTPEDRMADVPARELRRAREDGRALDERWHLRKDGSRFFASGVMTALLREGALIGFSKIARDVTDAKNAEAQLKVQLATEATVRGELQEAAALKDEFLAVMSHELKHPLNLILVNAELLARMPEVRGSPAVANSADVIRRTVLGQARIIDDLLDLSRAHTGKVVVEPVPTAWSAAVLRVVHALQADAKLKGVVLQATMAHDTFVVHADPTRMEQIVWNLVSNALKFTGPGGTVTTSLHDDGEMVRLDVQDTGRGLDALSVSRVFDMFWQANRGNTRSDGGMGIGLALVKLLTEQHGGRVAVRSDGPGRGACFSVWLPRAALGSGAAAAPPPSGLQSLRLLLVDDTADTVDALGMLLELEGAKVMTAGNGDEALRLAASHDFDVLLSDIAMPGMDGHALMRAWRQIERNAGVIAIAATGFGRPIDAQRALDAGFNGHLSKPITLDALTLMLERLRQR